MSPAMYLPMISRFFSIISAGAGSVKSGKALIDLAEPAPLFARAQKMPLT